MMPRLTIFTPSYNRADTLPRLYESLKQQTNKDFVWLIIDDGSVDNTKNLVMKWKSEEESFHIRYIYKENGGLHTGYNCAIANTDTELMMCVDSDDFIPYDAVQRIIKFWSKNGSDKYAGIVGLDFDLNDKVIGDKLPEQKSINLIDLLIGKYNLVNGDRTNVVRTDLYKSVAPMKSFEGEKNFNPHYMHLLISEKYDFLILNENLKYVEYQPDGMTNSIFKQYVNSPNSFLEIRKLYLSYKDASLKFKIKNVLHYISSSILAGKSRIIRDCPQKFLCLLLLLPGWMFSFYVRKKAE